MNTIWIIPIEPIDQRYTKQWYDNIPKTLAARIGVEGLDYQIVIIAYEYQSFYLQPYAEPSQSALLPCHAQ